MKRNILKYAVIVLILAGSFFSCTKDNPLDISFTEYVLCDVYCNWIDLKENEEAKITVIDSKKEFEKYTYMPEWYTSGNSGFLDCTTLPEIDFSRYTLLLVQGWTIGYHFYTTPEEFPKPFLIQLRHVVSNRYNLKIEMQLANELFEINKQWNRAFVVNKIRPQSIFLKVETRKLVIFCSGRACSMYDFEDIDVNKIWSDLDEWHSDINEFYF